MIPPLILQGFNNYVKLGVPPGGFLRAVLENDLKGAFGKADLYSRAAMFEIVDYLYNEVPAACQGSPEKVTAWLEAKAKEREGS